MSAAELKEYSNLIGGKAISAHNGRSLEMIDPCNGRAFATIPDSDEADINAAVSAAQGALNGDWGKMAPSRAQSSFASMVSAHYGKL